MAEILVTGANGFIGAHLVEELLAREHNVVALVRTTSDVSALADLPAIYRARLSIVTGDLRTTDLAPILAHAEYVYHLAAVLLASSRSEFFETNVEGTKRLLEQLERRRHPQFKRVLVTSSQAAAGPSPTEAPIDETTRPAPVSWYGESKVEMEKLALEASGRGLPVSIVRPVAVYGERERDLSRAIFPVVSMGLRPRVGPRTKTLTLVYVKDLVRGMIAVAESPVTLGRTYFLANAGPNVDNDFVDAVAVAVGKRRLLPVLIPVALLRVVAGISEWVYLFTRMRPTTTRDKVREVRCQHWAASPAAAKREVKWQAEVPLGVGIKASVDDWRTRSSVVQGMRDLPDRDRRRMTYALAVLFGALVEGTAWLGQWYTFHPRWLIIVIILVVFGGIMGTLTFRMARWTPIAQFVAGAAVGIGFELANGLWLHRWEFNEAILQLLPSLPVRSVVLGLPAGLLPLVLTTVLRQLYLLRRRIG